MHRIRAREEPLDNEHTRVVIATIKFSCRAIYTRAPNIRHKHTLLQTTLWSGVSSTNQRFRSKSVTIVIGSSDEVHMVDALAITGDEGRCRLR